MGARGAVASATGRDRSLPGAVMAAIAAVRKVEGNISPATAGMMAREANTREEKPTDEAPDDSGESD